MCRRWIVASVTLGIAAILGCASGSVCPVGDTPLPLFPAPRFMVEHKESVLAAQACVDTLPESVRTSLEKRLRERGLEPGEPCNWTIQASNTVPSLDGAAAAAWQEASGREDAYVVRTRILGGHAVTTLHASSPRGLFYAAQTAAAATHGEPGGARVTAGDIVDHPGFGRRGVIEGIYGIPYSTEERAVLLRTMGALRENVYIYSPKQDPYCRELWHLEYPVHAPVGPTRDVVQGALDEANANFITYVWGISPGLTYNFRDHAREFGRLRRKIDAMRRMGVRHFALFLDDILHADPDDHARLANDLHAFLMEQDPQSTLMFVGSSYAGAPDGYARTLGDLLHPDIQILWTGPKVVSERIRVDDLSAVNAALKRQVGIWDNWPREQHPVRGRDEALQHVVHGLYSNPVINEFNLQPFPEFLKVLGPIADYLWNPERYEATSSYARWQDILRQACAGSGR